MLLSNVTITVNITVQRSKRNSASSKRFILTKTCNKQHLLEEVHIDGEGFVQSSVALIVVEDSWEGGGVSVKEKLPAPLIIEL